MIRTLHRHPPTRMANRGRQPGLSRRSWSNLVLDTPVNALMQRLRRCTRPSVAAGEPTGGRRVLCGEAFLSQHPACLRFTLLGIGDAGSS